MSQAAAPQEHIARAPEPMLKISGIHSYYGAIEALRGVDVEIDAGEIVTLIGANGAGKSTLLMSLFGSPRPRTGSIRFRGTELVGRRAHEVARLGIAQVPEGRRVFPGLTVLENLQLGATLADPAHFAADIAEVFALFPILHRRKVQRAGTLSGGEQQMLAIGRALMSRPTLLLLDEPSLGLAPLIVKQIFATIRALNEDRGMTIFLVEQNAHQALHLAHRGYVLANGKVVKEGSGAALLADEDVQRAYLEGG